MLFRLPDVLPIVVIADARVVHPPTTCAGLVILAVVSDDDLEILAVCARTERMARSNSRGRW